MAATGLGLTRGLHAALLALAVCTAAPAAGPAAAQPACDSEPVPQILKELRDLARMPEPGPRRTAIAGLIDRWAAGPSIARMALHGRWDRLSAPDRLELGQLLRQLTAIRAAIALARDGITEYALLEARPIAGGDCLVTSRVIDRRGRTRIVHWRMRSGARGARSARFVDLLVDGISLTRNLRDELDAILRDNGGDTADLARRLRTTIARTKAGRR